MPKDSAIGVDAYNLQLTGGVAMTLRAKAADSEHIPCVIVPLTEKRFFEWHEDDTAVTLRNKSGSYGGGSEVLIVSQLSEHCATTITKASTDKRSSRESG